MRGKTLLIGLALGLLLVGWASLPPTLALPGAVPELPDDLDSYLAARESAARREFGLIPGTESRIRWYDGPGSTTAISIVYLHGFSATRQEIAPVGEMIADRLGNEERPDAQRIGLASGQLKERLRAHSEDAGEE